MYLAEQYLITDWDTVGYGVEGRGQIGDFESTAINHRDKDTSTESPPMKCCMVNMYFPSWAVHIY